jgi:cytochrome c5
MTLRSAALLFVTSLMVLACGAAQPEPAAGVAATTSTTSTGSDASEGSIAALYRARCGQCHVRVERGTRTREVLGPAMERHKKRAHLSDSDVRGLVDYLAR